MKNFKGFIFGVLTTLIITLFITTVFAADISRTLTATYRDIKITIDGTQIEPKDANGNTVEPFIVDGTTYLPVRAIADAIGYTVAWDGNSNTVILTSPEEKEEKDEKDEVPISVPTAPRETTIEIITEPPTITQPPTEPPKTTEASLNGVHEQIGEYIYPAEVITAPPETIAAQSQTVYWTESGSVYHSTANCRSLARSTNIRSGTIAASGKPRGCNICVN